MAGTMPYCDNCGGKAKVSKRETWVGFPPDRAVNHIYIFAQWYAIAGLPKSLLDLYSYQADDLFEGMVKVKPAKLSTVRRHSSSSSLGLLDELPLELLTLLLGFLDLRSISRLSQVSLRGHAVVQFSHMYSTLVKHAPHAMTALGKTGSICYHSLTTVHTVLLSDRCISCGYFGSFLYLPTCERCCYECLNRNQSLWVVPIAQAKRCFDLDNHHIKRLPVIRNLPGRYKIGFRQSISYVRQLRFVSVKSVKAVGIEVHGSTEKMPDWSSLYHSSASTKDRRKYNYMRILQDAPMQPLEDNSVIIKSDLHTLYDKYGGMATVPFPSLLSDGQPESGLWCRGCEWACEELIYHEQEEIEAALGFALPPECDVEIILIALKNRARSKVEFVRHVRDCYGAQHLPPDWWKVAGWQG